jgi:putative transposase
MAADRRRRRAEPTDDWGQLELLCGWPEQRDYELIRPMVLFGSPASVRAKETGAASERTLQRRAAGFEAEGMESLFGSEAAMKRKRLPPSVRRLIVDLKAEHPVLNPNEIAAICCVRFSRRPDRKTVKRVLAEEPVPLRMVRRFAPYHEIEEAVQRCRAVVALHAEGWSAKAIARYLRVGTSTVYRTLKRWVEEGPARASWRCTAPSTDWRSPRGHPRRSGRCPSRPGGATSTGAPTSATSRASGSRAGTT